MPRSIPGWCGRSAWMVPGGREIAVATSELMKKYDLPSGTSWNLAAGKDFDLTSVSMHTVEKSAEILVNDVVHAAE